MQPIINAQAPEFKVEAFHNGEFKTISSADLALPSFAPQSSLTSLNNTASSKSWALKCTQ